MKVFDGPGVKLLVGGGIPYSWNVLYDINERRIERSRRHDDNVSG